MVFGHEAWMNSSAEANQESNSATRPNERVRSKARTRSTSRNSDSFVVRHYVVGTKYEVGFVQTKSGPGEQRLSHKGKFLVVQAAVFARSAVTACVRI
jgi:hypothetical protein